MIARALYDFDETQLSRASRAVLFLARLLFVTIEAFFRERLQMRAAGISFFTVVSIAPFLALVFAAAKLAGAYDTLVQHTVRPFLRQTFRASASDDAASGVVWLHETSNQLLELIAETDVRGLGAVGLVVLAVTIHRVVRGAEDAFDAIWGFSGHRPLVRRLPSHLLVLCVTPAALVAASTATAAVHGGLLGILVRPIFGELVILERLSFLLSPVLICGGVLLLYLVLPSAGVRKRSALLGALVGGLGWYALQILHVRFQLGVARANAVYAGFGALPIFLLWLHLSWVMILLGAKVAATHQDAPTLRQLARPRLDAHASRQMIALRAVLALARNARPIALRPLARRFGVGVEPLRGVLTRLVAHGLLRAGGERYNPVYALELPPERIRIAVVLEAVASGAHDTDRLAWNAEEVALGELMAGLRGAAAASSCNRTLRELIDGEDPTETAEARS